MVHGGELGSMTPPVGSRTHLYVLYRSLNVLPDGLRSGSGEAVDDPGLSVRREPRTGIAMACGRPVTCGAKTRKDVLMKNDQKTTEQLEALTVEELARVAGGRRGRGAGRGPN
jgi:hypothetical protein